MVFLVLKANQIPKRFGCSCYIDRLDGTVAGIYLLA